MLNFNIRNRKNINIDCGNKVIFTVIGLSGSNSYLAYELAQIASLSEKTTEMIFVDNKTVTEADIVNGKFLRDDLRKYRAEVTAERCSGAFNLDIETKTKSISNTEDILSLYRGKMGYFPIIICNEADESTLYLIKESLKMLSDVCVILNKNSGDFGDISLIYKENGGYKTNNYLEDISFIECNSIKDINLESSKTTFLYLDDILCERSLSTERTLFNLKSKKSISRFIGEEDIVFDDFNLKESLKVDVNNDILIVTTGIGGTGATIAYELAHMASNSSKNIKLVFIDGDIVEEKNLNRQKFIINDLNNYKARVTSRRCKKAYNIDIETISDYIAEKENLYDLIRKYKGYTPILLGCSDSLKLRYLFCNAIKEMKNEVDLPQDIVYIDAANSIDYGQVIFTYIKNGKALTPDYFENSPASLEDVSKAKLVTELSCDELMVSSPQTKGANMGAAIGMYSYVHDIVNEKPIWTYLTTFNNKNKQISSKTIESLCSK